MATTLTGGPTRQPSPSPENAQLGVSVDDAAAATYSAPAASAAGTATNPAAPTAYSAATLTDPVTKTEGEAISAALATLRGEVATYELAISALVVDVATRRTEINGVNTALIALAADVDDIRTQFNELLDSLRGATPNPVIAT